MSSQTGKVIVVTKKWGGLGLATLMMRQGSDVLCAYKFEDLKDKDLSAAEHCGDGMVEKMPLDEAVKKFQRTGALWLFDSNDLPKEADKLRGAGELVTGTSAFAAKMEDDRDYAARLAKKIGFQLGETVEFTNYELGVKFLKQHYGKAYVFKPYEGDPELTFVPQKQDGAKYANEELQEYIFTVQAHDKKTPHFVLQEQLDGVEINFDLWVHEGKPLVAFVDLESKRKLAGDLGENVGCAGDFVFKVPMSSKGIRETVSKYLALPEIRNYTGSVDVNVMLVEGKYYFLENCFRFGYNAYPTIFQGLATRNMEEIMRAWVTGKPLEAMFSGSFASSLTMICDHPSQGFPVLLKGEAQRAFYPYSVYKEEKRLAMVECVWPDIGCVIAGGMTMEAAQQQCLGLAKQVIMPNKAFRNDLASDKLPTLPIARYRAMQSKGLLR